MVDKIGKSRIMFIGGLVAGGGSLLFGIGWGLCGVCPGPAIAGLGASNLDLLWALAGIAAGALAQGLRAKA